MTDFKISVVTPVYNGERFLAEALESVLAQTYQNWELVLLDNNSTDKTGEIAREFAARDSRVRLFSNAETVDVISNHNIVVQHMAPDADYCKVVHADDVLLPECLEKMVALANEHPSVGVIGAWAQWGDKVMSQVEPYTQTLFTGAEMARKSLLGESYPFISPSCLMIRNDVLLARESFYESDQLHADVDAAYAMLETCDFGLVQELLVHIRKHEDSVTSSSAQPMNTQHASNIELLGRYGPKFLEPKELEQRFAQRLDRYYLVLARSLVEGRAPKYWQLHRKAMAKAGKPLSSRRLYQHVLHDAVFLPRGTLHRLGLRFRGQPNKQSLHGTGDTTTMNTQVDSKLVQRWRRNWMKLAHHPRLGRVASRLAAVGMPPHYGRLPLSRLSKKGYISAKARIAHGDFAAGNRCFVGDGVLVYEDKRGGSVRLEDGVHLHENNTIQTGDGGSVVIGAGTHVQPRCQFSAYKGDIVIGKEVEIAPGVGFYPYNHSMDPSLPIQAQPIFSRNGIRVDDEAWIGYGAILLDGVHIGRGAVVAAGAVVNSDIPAMSIAAGVPAKVVSTREKYAQANPLAELQAAEAAEQEGRV